MSKFSGLKNQLPKLRFEILLIIWQFVAESIRELWHSFVVLAMVEEGIRKEELHIFV
jgi:hypothetical protein